MSLQRYRELYQNYQKLIFHFFFKKKETLHIIVAIIFWLERVKGKDLQGTEISKMNNYIYKMFSLKI